MISEPYAKFNRFGVINQIGFFIFVPMLYRNGESKFISKALVKINPQNELGDIISDPCVKLNRFRVVVNFS